MQRHHKPRSKKQKFVLHAYRIQKLKMIRNGTLKKPKILIKLAQKYRIKLQWSKARLFFWYLEYSFSILAGSPASYYDSRMECQWPKQPIRIIYSLLSAYASWTYSLVISHNNFLHTVKWKVHILKFRIDAINKHLKRFTSPNTRNPAPVIKDLFFIFRQSRMIFGSIPHHIQKKYGFDSTVCTCLNQIEIILP